MPVPRGKMLGGSSSINYMMYVRGHPGDFDSWAAGGATGWSYDEVLPYFRKSEGLAPTADVPIDAPAHNASGPLGVSVRSPEVRLWLVDGGGWFILDDVVGKHEFITYALGLNADGSVKQIEIMDYRETYGDQIRNEQWRAQFIGKKAGAKLKLDDDIKNISGATLSCRHIADGVRRLLAFHDLVLKH